MRKKLTYAIFAIAASVALQSAAEVPRTSDARAAGKYMSSQANSQTGIQPSADRNTTQYNHIRSFGHDGLTRITSSSTLTVPPMRQMAKAATAAAFEVYGTVVASDGGLTEGVYSITNAGFRKLGDTKAAQGGAFGDGTTYYVINKWIPTLEMYDLYKYDMTTWWKESNTGIQGSYRASDLSYDPVSKKVYGCFSNGQTNQRWEFCSADFSASSPSGRKKICDINIWNACAFNAAGELFIIDLNGELYSIDKQTGRHRFIGATGVSPFYQGSAAISPVTGKMYWSVSPETGNSGLYEVSLTDGSATLLMEFPGKEQVVGLYVPGTAVKDDAPGMVSDLKAVFPDGALQGTLDFTLPATLFSGATATGEVSWEIKEKGWSIGSGKGGYGEKVSFPFATSYPGTYSFSIICTNEAGSGPETEISVFIGKDSPLPPSNVRAVRSRDKVTLSWNPCESGAEGGFFDPSKVTYSVTRYIGDSGVGELVAEGIEANTFTDTIDEPDEPQLYSWCVQAIHDGYASFGGFSNRVCFGSYIAPFAPSLSTKGDLEYFITEDRNGDSFSWDFYQQGVVVAYTSRSGQGNDDWLISPAIVLEAGKSYTFSADFKTYKSTNPDQFEVMIGDDCTSAAMTVTVIGKTVAGETYVSYEGEITVPVTGKYHIGVHNCSPDSGAGLYMRYFRVSAPGPGDTPADPVDFTVTPALDGSAKASISLKAPAVDRTGAPLGQLSKIELSRDGEVIRTFDSPTPGSALTHEDVLAENATHTYRAVAFNASGEGRAASSTVYVGIPVPATPADATAVETSSQGEVTLSWTPVTTDVDGNPIRPEMVRYYLIDLVGDQQVPIADNLTETSYTFTSVSPGEAQAFKQFAVAAKTSAGFSQARLTEAIPVGEPYALPYTESFAGGKAATIFGTRPLVSAYYGKWSIAGPDTFTDMEAADGDGGYAYHYCKYIDCPSMLFTGKIALSGARKPILSFYLHDAYNDIKDKLDYANTSELEVMIDLLDGKGYRSVKKNVIYQECDRQGWNLITIDLSPYAGKTVQIGFVANTKKWTYVNIDAIRIGDITDHDILAKFITIPELTAPGKEFNVDVRVENLGSEPTSDYTVELFRNGEITDIKEGPTLGVGERATVRFTQTLTPDSEEETIYHATVVYSPDMDNTNNTTAPKSIALDQPTYPMVRDLTATSAGNGFALDWTKPDLESITLSPITDTFESYSSWACENVGEWLFFDEDKGGAGGCQGVIMPGVPEGSEQSWFVLDARLESLDRNLENTLNFSPHSGDKMLTAIYSMDFSSGPNPTTSIQNSDWAISPRLSGEAQTVKFWARAYSAYFDEQFEIYYSKASNDLDDFELLTSEFGVKSQWKEFEYTLPEGARYFAIRYTSDYCYMLFVDDVTYTPADSDPLQLIGYNIYRDGIRLNDEPVTATSFADADPPSTHHYAVSAVYRQGESRPRKQIVDFIKVGADQIAADRVVKVFATEGHIRLAGAEGRNVDICSANGTMFYSGKGKDAMSILVPSGIYIVRAGASIHKVIVR